MSDGAPRIGDWFLIPQAVYRVDPSYGDDIGHRYIVKSSWPGPTVTLLLRSTKKWFEGRDHAAHGGSCGSSTCALDLCGRISLSKIDVDSGDLETKSCAEPDEDVVEWVMAAQPVRLNRKTRRG